MSSSFQQNYIVLNLFRPEEYECYCDEISGIKTNHLDCFCIPNNIMKFTSEFFGLGGYKKSTCSRFGISCKHSISKNIGFSIHQLDPSLSRQIPRDIINMRKLTIPKFVDVTSTTLKDKAELLCAHFGTILKTMNMLESSTDASYLTMLSNISDAYIKEGYSNESLLREIYFYICFFVKGLDTFNAADLERFFKKIKKGDPIAASKIIYSINSLMKYCNESGDYLSSLCNYFRSNKEKNYCVCVAQVLEKMSTYAYPNGMACPCELLGCNDFIELSRRVNTAFPKTPSANSFDSHVIIERLNQL